jgi:hypothetical protein
MYHEKQFDVTGFRLNYISIINLSIQSMRSLIFCSLIFVLLSGCSTTEKAHTDFERGTDLNEIHTALSILDHLKRISGLNIDDRGGDIHISMRGVHTVSGENNVLFVLNGRQIGNRYSDLENSVDVNDIEDIRLIRGTMGAQLYGIRGANGVVEITTK